MKKPRGSRRTFGRISKTPGSDVSSRCKKKKASADRQFDSPIPHQRLLHQTTRFLVSRVIPVIPRYHPAGQSDGVKGKIAVFVILRVIGTVISSANPRQPFRILLVPFDGLQQAL